MSLLQEIEWRKLLVKRLKSSQAVLRRDASTEEKLMSEAKQLAAGYEDYAAAHEAYGWAEITWEQLDAIQAIFEDEQESKSRKALKRLTQMIGAVEGEINMMLNDPDYRLEVANG
jgi:hypothetical protein